MATSRTYLVLIDFDPLFKTIVLYLIHFSRMDFSTLIYWKSLFAVKGVLGVIF